MLTVERVWARCLPPGTRLVAGANGLQRSVSWPVVMRQRAPGFGHLRGGEFAIVGLPTLRAFDESLTVAQVIRQLAPMKVAALAVIGDADDDALVAADRVNLPLFVLPDGTSRSDVQRLICEAIADERARFHRETDHVRASLLALAVNGRDVAEVVAHAADLIGAPVALTDGQLELREFVAPPGSTVRAREAATMLSAGRHEVLRWSQTIPLSVAEPPARHFLLVPPDLAHVVAPVVAGGAVDGWLTTIGHWPELPELHRPTLVGAAAACAIHAARRRAVFIARQDSTERMLADVLLASEVADQVAERAERLGLTPTRPHVVLILETVADSAATAVVDEFERSGGRAVMTTAGRLVGVIPIEANDLREAGAALVARLANVTGNGLSVGVGRVAWHLRELPRSRREAERALELARRRDTSLGLTLSGTWFRDDLALTSLLATMADSGAGLDDFADDLLRPLEEFDRQHEAALLATLAVYLDAQASPSETATRLNLHRGALQRRLDRIAALTGRNLRDALTLLEFQIALRARAICPPSEPHKDAA